MLNAILQAQVVSGPGKVHVVIVDFHLAPHQPEHLIDNLAVFEDIIIGHVVTCDVMIKHFTR